MGNAEAPQSHIQRLCVCTNVFIFCFPLPLEKDEMKLHPRWLAATLALAVLAAVASAKSLPRGDARAQGFSPVKLERIPVLLNEAVDKKQIAGCVALIARRGKVIHVSTAGFQDIENKTPTTEGTIFRIASMSKPITSVAVMQLVEDGKLKLGSGDTILVRISNIATPFCTRPRATRGDLVDRAPLTQTHRVRSRVPYEGKCVASIDVGPTTHLNLRHQPHRTPSPASHDGHDQWHRMPGNRPWSPVGIRHTASSRDNWRHAVCILAMSTHRCSSVLRYYCKTMYDIQAPRNAHLATRTSP